MKLKKHIRNLFISAIILCNVGCDQVSKSIVRKEMSEGESFSFINQHFTIYKVENTGAFLSLGNSLPFIVKFILLSLLPILVILGGTYVLMAKTNLPKRTLLGFCFVIGGGIGNLCDRVIYGSVTDFMHVNFGLFQTGIFNMADVSIMIGLGVILLDLYLKHMHLNPKT